VILYWNFARKAIIHSTNLTFHESEFPQRTDFPDEPDEAFLRPPLDHDDDNNDDNEESDHEEPSHPFKPLLAQHQSILMASPTPIMTLSKRKQQRNVNVSVLINPNARPPDKMTVDTPVIIWMESAFDSLSFVVGESPV
jgi:hypothetical protein